MHYGITREATDFTEETLSDWRTRLLGVLLFFVPRANPDNEPLYPKVRAWALELSEDGWPQREVALDAHGKPLFCAPNDRNTGFWPDMAIHQFSMSDLEPISPETFNAWWTSVEAAA